MVRVPWSTRFTDLVGCQHPVQQAAMGGMMNADLALAVATAGGLGMLSGTVGATGVAAQLDGVADGGPVGVNFLVPFLDPAALDVAAERSTLVEFFWGAPPRDLVARAHAGDARAAWQIGSLDEARAAADAGCDLVIVQGVEAGGHVRGTVGVLPLLDEVRRVLDVPLVAAGGIGSRRAIAAALLAGADAVRVGTRFLAAPEAAAHPDYVDALIRADAEDTVLTTAFGDGWPDAPHRVLRSCVDVGEALGDAQAWTPLWPTAADAGPIDARALYAGQSVTGVRARQPAGAIVAELVDEAARYLPR
jgi:nitronate monooxygenase